MKLKKENLIAHEILGMEVHVLNKEGKEIGSGIIYNETRETIEVKSKDVKKFIKRNHDFIFIIGGEKVKIKGKYLIGRPEERIKRI